MWTEGEEAGEGQTLGLSAQTERSGLSPGGEGVAPRF